MINLIALGVAVAAFALVTIRTWNVPLNRAYLKQRPVVFGGGMVVVLIAAVYAILVGEGLAIIAGAAGVGAVIGLLVATVRR